MYFTGVGPRAFSNGINSAIFFMFFEAMRAGLKRREERVALEKRRLLRVGYNGSKNEEFRGRTLTNRLAESRKLR